MAKHATTKRHQKTKAPVFVIIFFILAIIATIIVLKIFKVVDFGKNVNHSTETTEKIHQKTDQPNESSGLPIHTEDGTKEDAAAGRTPPPAPPAPPTAAPAPPGITGRSELN